MLEAPLRYKGKIDPSRGSVIIRAEAIHTSNERCNMQFEWQNPGNVTNGCCGPTVRNVRFQFYRNVNNAWHPTYTSQYALNPQFPNSGLLKIPVAVLCNGDKNS
jgi:hypothetical protein